MKISLGPVIGGAFASSSASWRWAFYINLCLAGVLAPVYLLMVPMALPPNHTTVSQALRNLDWIGTILSMGASAALLMLIDFGGAFYAWNSAQLIVLYVFAPIIWTSFAIQQAFRLGTNQENQLVQLHIVKNRELCLLFAQIAAAMTIAFVPVYFIPIYAEFALGYSPIKAGVQLLPYVFVVVFGMMLSGALLEKFPIFSAWCILGSIFAIVGGALMTIITPSFGSSLLIGYSVILGFGAGILGQGAFAVAQALVETRDVASVTAFIGCGQIWGITLTLSISNIIYIDQATSKAAAALPTLPTTIIRGIAAGADSSLFTSLSPTQQSLAVNAIVSTIGNLFIMIPVAGGITLLLAISMSRKRLNLKIQ